MLTILISLITLVLFFFVTKLLLKKTSIDKNSEPTQVVINPEMPIKPAPVNCQKAIFRPAPENYSYYDCCGKLQEGEGFQPWEKRAPVSIDANKEFINMDLIGEESEPNC